MRNIIRIRSWPKVTSLIMAVIPVAVLAFIMVNLLVNSRLAIRDVGLGEMLFSTEFSGVFEAGRELYGLVPTLWGTFLAVVIAIAIALPVSLAMAVFSSEFPLGFLGRGMRGILGLLSGIPPIVYALASGVLVRVFMIPNFTGGFLFETLCAVELGLYPPEEFPPWPWRPGGLPWGDPNSTLLGGIMLALLIIPFVAPLIHDAIENVPHGLKEASLALGANRWHTLIRVTLPLALSGIIAATALGALKAMGDVMIAGWVIGWAPGVMPVPLWDVLEASQPLTSTGAGLVGLENPQSSGTEFSVANFTGLLLLVMAFAIMGLTTLLQRKFWKRFSS
ncbi:MAG: Phosphate transport system permease protein PstC [Chloroflexi bacterium]|nr:Phosphate transport system permease protein PstC [Chloroflexota bacterium]